MASIDSINNSTWGLSTAGYGAIAEGIALIRQSIYIILRTSKGSDPLRPFFGSDVYKYVDLPLNIAIPSIKKEIVECLELWETRIKVKSIRHSLPEPHNPVFEINYTVVDEDLIDKIIFDVRAGQTIPGTVNEILLQAFFPANPNNYRYGLSLNRNGLPVTPLPDPGGYSTINELFEWAKGNWFFWGRWFLLNDRIVCYMNSQDVVSATLAISVLAVKRIEALFPVLSLDQCYKAVFTINGNAASPEMPQTYTTPGEVLLFAQSNWGQFGNWFIEGITGEGESVFTDEFSYEFDVMPEGFKLILISEIPGFTGELQITTAS